MDKISKEARSRNMSKIRSKDTKPEVSLRSSLHRHGYRFRKNDSRLPGKADIYLPKYKTVIFVNGCFWHKHEGCKYYRLPKSNTEYWEKKLEKNVQRDKRTHEALVVLGYSVIVVWECEIRKNVDEYVENVLIPKLQE